MLANIMVWGLIGWLAAIAGLVAYRCLNGGITLKGILTPDAQGQVEGRPAPERVQLLVMFLFALAAYARLALTTSAGHSMPPVPPELLVLLGGSHGLYLSGKLTRALRSRREKSP